MNGEAINRVVELIRIGMGLDDAHVVTYNQDIPIPPDKGIFVAVGILDGRPFAGSLSYAPGVAADGVSPLLLERQTLNTREVLSIHLMSKSNLSRSSRALLTFALTNTLSQQYQERYGFLISRLPIGLVDASTGEGASRINRYNVTVAVLYANALENPVDYFDKVPVGSPQLVTNQ